MPYCSGCHKHSRVPGLDPGVIRNSEVMAGRSGSRRASGKRQDKEVAYAPYGLAKASLRRVRHPFSLTGLMRARRPVIASLGWPLDPDIPADPPWLPVELLDRSTGVVSWQVCRVNGSGYLPSGDEHDDEEMAIIDAILKIKADAREKEEGKGNPFDRPPVTGDIQRTGPDWRDGRNISTDEFLARFRFRGIQFGNWVTQKERQNVLNYAWDVLQVSRRPFKQGLVALVEAVEGVGHLQAGQRLFHRFNCAQVWMPGSKGNSKNKHKYLDEIIAEGKAIDDVWDLPIISSSAVERTGYPTQKPEHLLARIISASSKPGDIVLDAFGGSGTTCAVAEKFGRRWIGIDCGKLAIYTIQKRLLNLKAELGNKGAPLKAKPFTLYNAGLYDFARLKDLSWDDWRRFALTLFGCQDDPHRISGIPFDGTLKACPVLVFDHRAQAGKSIGEDTLRSIHEAAGSKIGTRMFIIAPAMAFDFQQDYVQIGEVRYYALRVPYSIIHELHQRDFLALKQPTDEMAVNDTVDAVGFDFIKTPELDYAVGRGNPEGELLEEAFIRIDTFYSDAAVREPMQKRGNRETLSMVMLDYDYDAEADVFDLDEVYYAGTIEAAGWEVRFPANRLGVQVMAVFLDIYGNEARVVIPAADFGPASPTKATRAKAAPKKATTKATAAKSKSKKA